MSISHRSLFTLVALGMLGPAFSQGQVPEGVEAARKVAIEKGCSPMDVQDLRVQDRYTDGRTGVEHIYFQQFWQGVPVYHGQVAVHRKSDGTVVAAHSAAMVGLEKRAQVSAPALSAEQALRSVLDGLRVPGTIRTREADGPEGRFRFTVDGFSEPPFVERCLVPVGDRLRTAWNVNVYLPDGSHWWNIRIDDSSGEELDRDDWVSHCMFDGFGDGVFQACAGHGAPLAPPPASPNDYRVYAWPLESPNHGPRTLQNAPWNDALNASPFGWHDTDGSAGPEFTITRGNNVWAQEDANGNNGTGYSPDGGVDLDFDFPIDLTQAPSTYQDAAITNLFYWNNIIHDVWYQYGFDEPSGNFQENNYGNGGVGGDHVLADAQDGSGTNNANFATPPDGSDPRMQMFLWNTASPAIDGDLDNGIIAHEYAHGVSNRLVGGPSNTSCLSNAEQMGEGWSDFFSLVMTMAPGDQGTDARGIGTFALAEPVTGPGIRPAPYSTDFGVNNFTYANTNGGVSQPHGIGFVWCTMLWEMTWELIAVHGFDPDLYQGTGGNNIAMQLVIDGLKLTPCNPGFVDGRDAILQADQILYGGANQDLIWAAFARRGLGASADQGSSGSRSDQTEAFDLPVDDNVGVAEAVHPLPGALFECGNGGVVKVEVRNNGLLDQANFPVSYQLDNGPVTTQNFPGTLPAGASAIMDIGAPLTVVGIGPHTFKAWTSLPTDAYLGDDTLSFQLELLASLSTPHVEDVEGGTVLPSGWTLENPDAGITWTTAALANGPDCGPTTAWRLDHYTYPTNGELDHLISPVFDLTGSMNSRLLFDHAYVEYSATYTDGFRVEVSQDCGQNWVVVFDESGADLATAPAVTANWVPASCSEWRTSLVDLSAFDGSEVQLRFVSVNGYGNNFYLDNVRVESAFAKDMAMIGLLLPQPAQLRTCDPGPQDVSVELWNAGADPQANVPVSWQLDNGPVSTDILPGPLAAGDTVVHTFSTPLVLPGSGAFELKVWTALGGDQNTANDTLTSDLTVDPAVSLPSIMDLESEILCSTNSDCDLTSCPLIGGWRNLTNGDEDDVDWRVDNDGTPSTNTGPSTDLLPGTAQGKYLYLEASSGCTGRTAVLESPCFDLGGTVQPFLRTGYHMFGSDMGELHVDLDPGTGWVLDVVPPIVGDQGDQWDTLLVDLSAWSGQVIRLRLRGVTGTGFASDMALDAIELFDAVPPLAVQARVLLEGPYDAGTGLMNDDLRQLGLIPLVEPFTGLGLLGPGEGGDAVDDPSVFTVTGPDAIVDWVLVELRDQVDPAIVVDARPGLVQRDGDVVGTDGVSPLYFTASPGDHHVAIRHRNHLGCMTAATVTLGTTPMLVDLAAAGTPTFGTDARRVLGAAAVLWAGEVEPDGLVKYTGVSNDRDPILQAIGGTVPTNSISGYLRSDVNMDGTVKYTGGGNDRDPILQNVGGVVPTATRLEQLP